MEMKNDLKKRKNENENEHEKGNEKIKKMKPKMEN